MGKIQLLLFVLILSACGVKKDFNSSIEFTSDLEKFENLSGLKEALEGVEIIALGENTHGLGEVFKTKVELVKFLHQELDFNLVLFESGFGEGALAWEDFDSLTSLTFTKSFTSNFYYHSEEINELSVYAKTRNGNLAINGFDCQPKQTYLIKRMAEIAHTIDTAFAKEVVRQMNGFNKLYQYEYDRDSVNFYLQRDKFILFLSVYDSLLIEKKHMLLSKGASENELTILKKSNQIFRDTYANITFGHLMGWPMTANIRDKSLFETVKWYKDQNPKTKMIIWAQNSHVENNAKPGYDVKWMGHNLKSTYGNKYYSIGSIVYSGKNLSYNETFDFEHKTKDYLAFHLNQFGKDRYVIDLSNYDKSDFISQKLLGMESNRATAAFIAKDRFDGLLFIKYSDVPKLLKEN